MFVHRGASNGQHGVLTNDQGYIANRNRTLQHMYDNEIGNNVFLAGDSHQNWVSVGGIALAWL